MMKGVESGAAWTERQSEMSAKIQFYKRGDFHTVKTTGIY